MFSLFAKQEDKKEDLDLSKVNPEINYSITFYDGSSLVVPGIFFTNDRNSYMIGDKYYYLDWDEVRSVLPMT